MKIIGLTGSPRDGSNSEVLVNEILAGASEAGAETKSFNLVKMDIKPCIACMYCKTHGGQCATNDDMQEIYKELKEADGFVVGSPLYFGQLSAQSKLFIDRLFAFYNPEAGEIERKKVAFVFSQGNPDDSMFKDYYEYTKNVFEMAYDVVDILVSKGNQLPGDVKNNKQDLEKARKIGTEIAGKMF
jgi:multimeric flavodoxin WrbA